MQCATQYTYIYCFLFLFINSRDHKEEQFRERCSIHPTTQANDLTMVALMVAL